MATVNLGAIKFNWKGTYNASTAYTIDDVVEYNGSSYVCKLASTGNLPTNTTYFDQMSAKGTDGTNGTDGTDLTSTLTTQGDLVYRDGSGLQRLGAGTSGQVLQTNGTGANPSWGTVSSDMVKTLDVDGGGANILALNSCFSSTYENYFITASIHTSTSAQVQLRMQDSSNNQSADYYFYAGEQVAKSSSSISGSFKGNWNHTQWEPHENTENSTNSFAQMDIWVHKPFLSTHTYLYILMNTFDGGSVRVINSGLQYRNNISCAGIRFFLNTGNITSNSNVKVYGLK